MWPAFWSNGPRWPEGGEIDIAEGNAPEISFYLSDYFKVFLNQILINIPYILLEVVFWTTLDSVETDRSAWGKALTLA